MDPESQKLLEEIHQLAEENNKMLHSLRHSMIFSRVLSLFYWILIIGSVFGAYYFIQPYIDQLLDVYGGTRSNLEDVGGIINNFKNNLSQ